MLRLTSLLSNRENPIIVAILILFGFLTCLFLTAGKPETNSNSDELSFLNANLGLLNQNAKMAYEAKKYREAKNIYIEILHHKPSDVSTLYNLASCYAKLNKPDLAAKALNFALEAGLSNITGLLADSTWMQIKDHPSFQPIYEKAKILKGNLGESFYTECKVLIRGHVRLPNDYESTKSYPLLVLLHGNGGNAESLMSVRDKMGATNFFVVAPQGPYQRKLLELNTPAYSWFLLSNDKKLWERADPLVIEYIINVIKDVKAHYKISGVYLLGHSQGGALAYMTGIAKPDVINGIICSGAQNPEEFINASDINNAASKLPVFISHGRYDPQVSFNEAQEAKNLLIRHGVNVTFKPFDGGHWLDEKTLIEVEKWIEEKELLRLVK